MAKSRFQVTRGAGVAFRNTIQTVHDKLLECGLVASTDTGQLDIAGFTIPTIDATVGYRIYEMADSLSSAMPVKIRINWYARRNESASTFVPSVAAIISKETDGTGNAVGSILTVGAIASDTTSQQVLIGQGECFVNVKEGAVLICLGAKWHKVTTAPNARCLFFLSITRTRNAAGEFTADGIVVCTGPSTTIQTYLRSAVLTASGGTPQGSFGYTSLAPLIGGADASTVGGQTQLQHPWAVTPRLYPIEEVAMYYGASTYTLGDFLQVDVDGTQREYVALQDIGLQPSSINTTGFVADSGLAMLWED